MTSTLSDDDKQYFRFPRLPWLVVIPPAMAFVGAAALRPDLIPFDYLGPLKGPLQSFVNNHPTSIQRTAAIMYLVHGLEAIYATYYARKKKLDLGVALAWGAQTFVYGLFSYIPLRRHFRNKNKRS